MISGLIQWVQSLTSLSRLRIQHYYKLWHRYSLDPVLLLLWVQASSCNSNWTPTPETSICCGCSHKNKKQTKKSPSILILIYYAEQKDKYFNYKPRIRKRYKSSLIHLPHFPVHNLDYRCHNTHAIFSLYYHDAIH